LEPLSGYLALAEAMKKEPQKLATSFNFGPKLNDVLTVEELAQVAIKSWGTGKYKSAQSENALHEAGLLKLNISKATKELKWEPKWNAPEAVDRTIAWYHNSLKKTNDKFALCIKDIKDYSAS